MSAESVAPLRSTCSRLCTRGVTADLVRSDLPTVGIGAEQDLAADRSEPAREERSQRRRVPRRDLGEHELARRQVGEATEDQRSSDTAATGAGGELDRELGATHEPHADRDQTALVAEHVHRMPVMSCPQHPRVVVVPVGLRQRLDRRASVADEHRVVHADLVVAGERHHESRVTGSAVRVGASEQFVGRVAVREHERMAGELDDRLGAGGVGRHHLDPTVDRGERPVGRGDESRGERVTVRRRHRRDTTATRRPGDGSLDRARSRIVGPVTIEFRRAGHRRFELVPKVFVGVVGTLLVGTACAPDPPGAVVGIVVDSCEPGQDVGSGMIVAPGLALTAAHVVAGADEIVVHHGGREAEATIIGFDPEMDLAYLTFDAAPTPVMPVDSSEVEAGDTGTAYVVRDGDVASVPITIRRRVHIRTEDIYVQGETLRPGFDLDADIRPGDSGGAVVVDGRIAGVIWARSNRIVRRAYAIDPIRAGDLITEQLRSGRLGDDIDIARCH